MDKRGGQEAVKGLGLRKIYIPESMVVPEGSSPESGLGRLPQIAIGDKLQVAVSSYSQT